MATRKTTADWEALFDEDGNYVFSDEEMLRDFKVYLHQSLMRGELKSTALTQGLNSIRAMMPPPVPETPKDEAPWDILEQLPALPTSEAQRLLRDEITRLRERLMNLEDALITTAGQKGK